MSKDKIDYSRIYIYQLYSSICALNADSKEDAFEKLKVVIPLYIPDSIDDIESLDEFLIRALEELSD